MRLGSFAGEFGDIHGTTSVSDGEVPEPDSDLGLGFEWGYFWKNETSSVELMNFEWVCVPTVTFLRTCSARKMVRK